ncbi:MAG: hypothetical protein ACOY90_11545 [Candidatus Zhuqueibacterota bacterium]
MSVIDMLNKIDRVVFPDVKKPVYQTVADEVGDRLKRKLPVAHGSEASATAGELFLLIAEDAPKPEALAKKLRAPEDRDWSYIRLSKNGNVEIIVARNHLLFATVCHLFDFLGEQSAGDFHDGTLLEIGFKWNRPVYDCCLTQLDRTSRHMDWKAHIREYARLGFSHVEVNSLATAHGLEPGVEHEVYPVFYTYCPALDQFVSSKLNDGIYPREYLNANLSLLKKYATETVRYGLTPGLHSFEPRNVPDELLKKYPMLRGARVDHPFRSMKPRFSMALAHPFVRMHYKELIQNLLREVPELGYISIVTNDSGAGFEFTRSLYVGANGGAYLIREWKSVDDVAKAAAKNAMSFFKLLRDGAAEINPNFRVMFRLEPFADERTHMLNEIGERIDVEGSSFLSRGYGSAYRHELYEDVDAVQSTAHQNTFKQEEKEFMDMMTGKGSLAHVIYSFGLYLNFDPLLGIPFPWMLCEKLSAMRRVGAQYVVNQGGIHPPSLAPWCINREIVGQFQFNPDLDIDATLKSIARKWVGQAHADDLYKIWQMVQEAVRAYPPVGLYTFVGITWYRLWVRPLIPNIEAISEEDRAYYENYLLAPPHNPTRVDLNRDVLFELGGPDLASRNAQRMDDNIRPVMDRVLEFILSVVKKTEADPAAHRLFIDLSDRLHALKYWFITQRNAQAWIAGVHGYLRTSDKETKKKCRALLKEMVLSEIENTKQLLHLWETSATDFMLISGHGESVHQLGENFGELLKRKIELMQGHENDEPYVDPNFIWRVPGIDFYSLDEIDAGPSPVTGQLSDI